MLSIRKDQLTVLGVHSRTEFVHRLVVHLAAEYPGWYEERQDKQAREFIRRAIDIGESYEIRGRWAVVTFVEMMLEFGEAFEKSADREWAMELLRHRSLPDRLRVQMLSERLRERTQGRRIIELEAGPTD